MAMLIKLHTLTQAELILKQLECLVDDNPREVVILVSTFTTDKVSGYHLSGDNARYCNIVGSDSGDGFVVNYGTAADYDSYTHQAKNTAVRVDFRHNEVFNAADLAHKWLTYKLDK